MARLRKHVQQAGMMLLAATLAGVSLLLYVEGAAIPPRAEPTESISELAGPDAVADETKPVPSDLTMVPPLDFATLITPRAPLTPRSLTPRAQTPAPRSTLASLHRLGAERSTAAVPDESPSRRTDGPSPTRLRRGPPHADTRAVLVMIVNGVSFGEVVATLADDDVLVPLADLRRAGIVSDLPTVPGASIPVVSLARMAARMAYRVDRSRLELHLDADPVLLAPTRLSLAPNRPSGIVYSDDASGFINYALHADSNGGTSVFGELGFRAFDAFFSTTVSGGNQQSFIRGLSQVVIDDRDSLMRWTVGDVFQTSGNLGGGTFLAGITLTRELSLDPYLVTRPGLAFEGATRAPGTLEVYVDDALVRRLEVPAGPFQLDDLPIPTRSGNARYVLRDALGGTQTFERSYAMISDLLDPGLHHYSYSIGIQRNSLPTDSFDYGQPVALGRHRVGLTRAVTLGWRAELAPLSSLVSGGVEATMLLPFGRLDVGLHASTDQRDGAGAAAHLAWSLPGPVVNVSLYAIGRSDGYQQIGLDPTTDRHLLETGGLIGWNADPLHGSFEGRFSHSRDGDDNARGRATVGVSIMPGLDLQIAAGVTHDGRDTGIDGMALLSFVPGSRFTATVSERLGRDGSETVVSTNVPMRNNQLDAGVHTSLTLGDQLRFLAKPQVQTSFGLYQLGLAYDTNGFDVTADASGALVFVEGAGLELARAVRDSFAIVDLPDDLDVRVFRDNREVGRSDNGNILVNDLLPYYANRIAISVDDLPLDQEVGQIEQLVAPSYRGGAHITFDLRKTSYVRGRIVLLAAAGAPRSEPLTPPQREIVPANGSLVVATDPGETVSPLGRNAEFELAELLPGRYRATVVFGTERCSFWLDIAQSHEPIADLGLITCQLRQGNP